MNHESPSCIRSRELYPTCNFLSLANYYGSTCPIRTPFTEELTIPVPCSEITYITIRTVADNAVLCRKICVCVSLSFSFSFKSFYNNSSATETCISLSRKIMAATNDNAFILVLVRVKPLGLF